MCCIYDFVDKGKKRSERFHSDDDVSGPSVTVRREDLGSVFRRSLPTPPSTLPLPDGSRYHVYTSFFPGPLGECGVVRSTSRSLKGYRDVPGSSLTLKGVPRTTPSGHDLVSSCNRSPLSSPYPRSSCNTDPLVRRPVPAFEGPSWVIRLFHSAPRWVSSLVHTPVYRGGSGRVSWSTDSCYGVTRSLKRDGVPEETHLFLMSP